MNSPSPREMSILDEALCNTTHRTRSFEQMPRLALRVRLVSAVGAALACSLAAAAAQSPLHTQPNQKEKQRLAEQIASDGLNCPVVGVIDDAGKDQRGTMIRIHCRSLNGSASWEVRGIAARDSTGLRFETW